MQAALVSNDGDNDNSDKWQQHNLNDERKY